MRQILYVSSATPAFDEAALPGILHASRKNNSLVELSGLLLYAEGTFFQVLEGPEDPVMAIFERLKTDPRHSGVQILLDRYIAVRDFPNWSMGFESCDKLEDVPAAFFKLSKNALDDRLTAAMSTEVKSLIKTFTRTNMYAMR